MTRAADFAIGVRVFLRTLGVIATVAFLSLASQVQGLIGSHGILPAARFVARVRDRLDDDAWTALPGLHWIFGASDGALGAYCFVGALFGVVVALGFVQGPALLALALLYGTMVSLGQVFLGYQWDILLVEVLVLAALLAPWRLRDEGHVPALVPLYAMWLVVVRLELGSGLAKLASGDETWRDLTALTYHYETQCLPTWIGMLLHHLPRGVHVVECAVMFAIQLAAPIALFCGRVPRRIAVAALAMLQIAILLAGNYTFFNYLSIALTFTCLDDAVWQRLRMKAQEARAAAPASTVARSTLAAILAVVGLFASLDRLVRDPLPPAIDGVLDVFRPFHLANGYALFASMTTERDEIELEGTIDGVTWVPYVFPHKPGPVDRRPDFVAPHQPRLDWQMWFAALGDARQSPWMVPLMERLLDAEPTVLALFDGDPFHGAKPIAVRALRWRYHVAPLGDPAWWTREPLGAFMEPRSRP